MIRRGLSLLSGVFLAIGLLWLLALLVAPPEAEPELVQEMAMTLVKPPAPAAQAPATQPETPVTEAPPPPPPAPSPLPVAESQIAMPTIEVPDTPEPAVELDSRLPELNAAPEPEPAPKPEPAPEPTPEEPPREQVNEESASVSQDTGQGKTASQEIAAETAPNEPVNVGQVSPASRVNPVYPSRAQRRGLEGFVEVRFVIRRDGSVIVSSIEVTRAQPRRVFDRAAREAIAQWQFEPSGQRRRATQRIEFQLR
ncbi:energy transducer TonB [Halomonas llamarensis]|uniref:Protein TonB n=1 Tax=Halomonas llamarensis TaxID=2945104 RepID=A0ABT0SML4_9GAMM|nr:energy transducer TonB [Halomonas llamarensis]MCL7928813.1 TonB family protein [Halomonas llamarensis]